MSEHEHHWIPAKSKPGLAEDHFFWCECDETMSLSEMANFYHALKVKEKWHGQLVEWLRLFHSDIHKIYTDRIMSIHANMKARESDFVEIE